MLDKRASTYFTINVFVLIYLQDPIRHLCALKNLSGGTHRVGPLFLNMLSVPESNSCVLTYMSPWVLNMKFMHFIFTKLLKPMLDLPVAR